MRSVFFFKQKTAYEMRISDWSSDVGSSDLELKRRLDSEAVARLQEGPSFEKSIAPLRSFVAEPMRHGRLFLAGAAAHIVPPTGAKCLNLPASDVRYLWQAFTDFYKRHSSAGIDGYSAAALARVWKAERSEDHTSELQSPLRISYA